MIRFNKQVKRFLTAFLCICMLTGLLSGCGTAEESVDDVVTVITDDETAETVSNEEIVVEEEPSLPPEEETTTEEAYVFYAFMNGDGEVSDNRGKDIFEKNTKYTFQAMTERIHEYVSKDLELPYLGDISYAFIDCGADDKQELALKFEFCENEDQGYGNYIQYLIISADNNNLKVVYDGYTYYRSETIISDTGYIRRGGSDSAVSNTFDTSFVNEKGEEVFLYEETYTMGLEEPVIPSSSLVSTKVPENYQDGAFSDSLAYSVTRYNFNNIAVEDMLDAAKFDKYRGDNFFVLADPDGNDVSEEDYDAKLYSEMGVEILSYSDAVTKINDHETECGVSSAIKAGKDIVWYPYDKEGAFTEYKYSFAKSANKSSVEEQLKLLANSENVWRNDISDRSNSYVYYAVTDLDRNGRLEIIRCDYCYLPEFCKNRFYEVTPDYKSVRKMEYDVETMWAEGEESGSSHGLLNANLPVYCFWNSQYGKSSSDYTGISYYYIIPTREVHDGYESIVKMALCANNSGKVFTDFIGYANMNSETGEVSYMDYNGFDTTEEEFAKAEFRAYSADTGWECDKVNWSFFMLEGEENILESLTDSYNEYSHETIIRLY